MDPVLGWGVEVVLRLQALSPALDWPFRAITFLGEEDFFMLLIPLLYWCLDRRLGARLTFLFLGSVYLNTFAKVALGQPRPYQYDARVQQLASTTGGGLPSGHTQSAVAVWGYVGAQLRRRWLWVVAALAMILIPLSRLYLGLHFPTDLLGGYLIGAAWLALYCWLEPRCERWLVHLPTTMQVILALAVPLAALALLPTAGDESGASSAGVLMGMGTGLALERRWVGFEVGGSLAWRLGRLALGLAILLALRFGLKAAFAAIDPSGAFELLLRALRYGLMGLWGALGAPWAFVRLGWAAGRARRVVAGRGHAPA